MVTIKGTIIIGGKNNNLEKKLEGAGVKVKLPFEATGFSSTKMPKIADLSKIKLAGSKPITSTPVITPLPPAVNTPTQHIKPKKVK